MAMPAAQAFGEVGPRRALRGNGLGPRGERLEEEHARVELLRDDEVEVGGSRRTKLRQRSSPRAHCGKRGLPNGVDHRLAPAGIPAARAHLDGSAGVTIRAAASELGVSTQTIRRWVQEGLLPAEQTAAHAPWRIRLTPEIRARFKPEIPPGYLTLDQAARRLGIARQTVLNQVRAGKRDAIQVVDGKR
jgi:predicted DNA-binding protein (UPF0251 family)